jgi:hypothetical protein
MLKIMQDLIELRITKNFGAINALTLRHSPGDNLHRPTASFNCRPGEKSPAPRPKKSWTRGAREPEGMNNGED